MRHILLAIVLMYTALASQRSFVDTAPLSEGQLQGNDEEQDKTVQELENLKKSIGKLGKTLDLMKSQTMVYTNINGEKESHSETKEELKANGEPIGKVNQKTETTYNKEEVPNTKIETEVDIPHEGIHKTVVHLLPGREATITKNGNRRSPLSPMSLNILSENSNQLDKVDGPSMMNYSPMDVAEYVFWTGDENGVTSAIEEFLREGLMSREEAIAFLQEIKYHLENLKNHYTQIGLNGLQKPKIPEPSMKINSADSLSYYDKPELQNNFDIKQLRQEADKRRVVETGRPEASLDKITDTDKLSEEDYDELLERLRVADLLYTEYSLEEVVYQLAKVMFAQSLTRGSAEAQQALQKFTNFLEMEAAQGHISRALEKKVLDILIASISDTLTEHPELLTAAKEATASTSSNNFESQNYLRQILDASLDDNLSIQDLLAIKEQNKNNQLMQQNKKKLSSHVPFNFLKYKNT